MSGHIQIKLPTEYVNSPNAVIKFAGHTTDIDGNELVTLSRTERVEYRKIERVFQTLTGNITTLPPQVDLSDFEVLPSNEYFLYDALQAAHEGVSKVPYTFLFQPDSTRRPFFPHVGIFEVHFRFIQIEEEYDTVELLFECYVGGVQYPRKI
jgi:hypothetical protein